MFLARLADASVFVAVDGVAPVEELAYVFADVVLDVPQSAWVAVEERCDVKHQVVEYHKLSALFYKICEFFKCQKSVGLNKRILLSSNPSVAPLKEAEDSEEDCQLERHPKYNIDLHAVAFLED